MRDNEWLSLRMNRIWEMLFPEVAKLNNDSSEAAESFLYMCHHFGYKCNKKGYNENC